MPTTKELKNYLNDLSDIPEEYQPGFKTAIAMVDWERLSEELYDESSEELFPFIRNTVFVTVKLSRTFAETFSFPEIELLKIGLGRGLFAIQCTGTRNFSRVEWQIKTGIRSFVLKAENNGKMPKIKIKCVPDKPVKCPFCGSEDIKDIIYGLPAPDFDYSRYVPGGCCRMPASPQWHCDNCFAKFKKSSKRSKKI